MLYWSPNDGDLQNVTPGIDVRSLFQYGDDPSNPATGQQMNYFWKWRGFVLNGEGMGRTVPDTGLSHQLFYRLASTDNPQVALFQETHHRSLGSFRSTIELHPHGEHFTQVSDRSANVRQIQWEQ
jgi:hypothetical protein